MVLAGCATALDARKERSAGDGEEGEEVLPGLAAELLDHGAPAVLAMQAPVSDRYATDFGARLYRGLATRAEPAPLPALRSERHAGALIHGMGGVGNSTLAAEVLTRLVADGRWVISAVGETAPETVLEEVGKELLGVAQASGVPEDHPIR